MLFRSEGSEQTDLKGRACESESVVKASARRTAAKGLTPKCVDRLEDSLRAQKAAREGRASGGHGAKRFVEEDRRSVRDGEDEAHAIVGVRVLLHRLELARNAEAEGDRVCVELLKRRAVMTGRA